MWEFDISGAGSRFREKGEERTKYSRRKIPFLFFSSFRSVCVGNWMLFLCCLLLLLLLLSPPFFVAFVARRMWEIGAEKIFPPPPSFLAPNEQSGTRCGEIRQFYGEKTFVESGQFYKTIKHTTAPPKKVSKNWRILYIGPSFRLGRALLLPPPQKNLFRLLPFSQFLRRPTNMRQQQSNNGGK